LASKNLPKMKFCFFETEIWYAWLGLHKDAMIILLTKMYQLLQIGKENVKGSNQPVVSFQYPTVQRMSRVTLLTIYFIQFMTLVWRDDFPNSNRDAVSEILLADQIASNFCFNGVTRTLVGGGFPVS